MLRRKEDKCNVLRHLVNNLSVVLSSKFAKNNLLPIYTPLYNQKRNKQKITLTGYDDEQDLQMNNGQLFLYVSSFCVRQKVKEFLQATANFLALCIGDDLSSAPLIIACFSIADYVI